MWRLLVSPWRLLGCILEASSMCWRRLVSSRKLLRGPGRLLQGLMGVRVCSLLFRWPHQLGFWLLEASALGGILSRGGVFGARPVPCTPTRQVMQLRVWGPGGQGPGEIFLFFLLFEAHNNWLSKCARLRTPRNRGYQTGYQTLHSICARDSNA